MRRTSHGFTLIELLIVVAIIAIIAAIAIPSLLRARMAANEASAIGSLRSVFSSQQNYAASAARGGYAPDLPRLGTACPGGDVPFLSSELTAMAVVRKSGYFVEMQPSAGSGIGPNDCNNAATAGGFYLTAEAITPALTGTRAFAVTDFGSIWQNVGDASAPPLETQMIAPPTPLLHPLR
jgi:prepilin-type N-terminal cleavage/methylation domain-containing protein